MCLSPLEYAYPTSCSMLDAIHATPGSPHSDKGISYTTNQLHETRQKPPFGTNMKNTEGRESVLLLLPPLINGVIQHLLGKVSTFRVEGLDREVIK